MTAEDPRDHGLTAADLREAADLMYEPGDQRAEPTPWTHDQQVRRGQIRSRLRALADAIDADALPDIPHFFRVHHFSGLLCHVWRPVDLPALRTRRHQDDRGTGRGTTNRGDTMNDDAQALAWYRATFDDDQTSDDMVLARLDAWDRGQSLGPFRQGVPQRKGAAAGRVALLVDVMGSEHTDLDMPTQDWRHGDGRLVIDAEAELIRRTPFRDVWAAHHLLVAETDMYRQGD